jgi:hypothetical protein
MVRSKCVARRLPPANNALALPKPFGALSAKALSTVFIDNSTYFSFKKLSSDAILDADSVYNAANFLECLVTADRIFLAPTVYWKAGAEDTLFTARGPCIQAPHEKVSDEKLRSVFVASINSALKDLTIHQEIRALGLDRNSTFEAKELVQKWLSHVENDPREFLSTYSGAVYKSDQATQLFLSNTENELDSKAGQARHAAQYLLRTNVALEFAGALNQIVVPYHPHSHRAAYVMRKLAAIHKSSTSLGARLFQEAELLGQRHAQALKSSWLGNLGTFDKLNEGPLILAVCLSGARDPSEIMTRALEIRALPEAVSFRALVGELFQEAHDEDIETRVKAHAKLKSARRILAEELQKLYGEVQMNRLETISAVAVAVDVQKLAEGSVSGAVVSAGKHLVEKGKSLEEFFRDWRLQKKLALIVNLKREAMSAQQLNDLLGKVFKKRLKDSELKRLMKLRTNLDSAADAFKNKSSSR